MHLTPDQLVLWHWSFLHVNATHRLHLDRDAAADGRSPGWSRGDWIIRDGPRSRWQNALEVVVETMRGQIREICPEGGDRYLPFVGTLFLFIAISNLLGHRARLARSHRFALDHGGASDLRRRCRPCLSESAARCRRILSSLSAARPLIMLPFHLMSETSRNLALAVRLFGNMMSGSMIVGHSAGHRAVLLSRADAGAGAAHRNDSGLHLRHPGDGLHCGGGSVRAHAREQEGAMRIFLWIV